MIKTYDDTEAGNRQRQLDQEAADARRSDKLVPARPGRASLLRGWYQGLAPGWKAFLWLAVSVNSGGVWMATACYLPQIPPLAYAPLGFFVVNATLLTILFFVKMLAADLTS